MGIEQFRKWAAKRKKRKNRQANLLKQLGDEFSEIATNHERELNELSQGGCDPLGEEAWHGLMLQSGRMAMDVDVIDSVETSDSDHHEPLGEETFGFQFES